MFLPKPLARLVKVFRGDVAPFLAMLSVLLGFWFGLTPGFYGLHVAMLAIVLIFNVNIGAFLLSAMLGKATAFAAAPLLFDTGVWVMEHAERLLAIFAATPIIGITDFSRYAVAGALLLGLAIGLILGIIFAAMVQSFRRAILRFEENSETFRTWRLKGWVRFLDWLFLGRSVKDLRAVLTKRPRWIRLPGIAVAVVLVAGFVLAVQFVEKQALAEYAGRSLTSVNGAEVNLGSAELSITGGRIAATGLAITDPKKPTHNRLAIGKMAAQISLWNLSLGRVVMDEIEVSTVETDQKRKTPGQVIPEDADDEKPSESIMASLQGLDAAKLEAYLEDGKKIRQHLEDIREWLPTSESKAEETPPVPESYLANLNARAPGSPTPRLVIRRVVLNDVSIPLKYIGMSDITCSNLSDAPSGAMLPVILELKSKARPTTARLVCDYSDSTLEVALDQIDLAALQSELSNQNPVVFEGGTATASISGKLTQAEVDLAIHVKTKNMKVRCVGGALGLDPEVTAEAMKILENLETTLRLVGPLTEPRLVFDTNALTGNMKDALVRAGKAQLASRVDQALAGKLPKGMPNTAKMLEKPDEAAKEAVGGLLDEALSGKDKKSDKKEKKDSKSKKDKKDNEDKKKDDKKKLPDLLKPGKKH